MCYERNNEGIWETCQLFRYADGVWTLIIFTYTHAQSKCPLCRSLVTSSAILPLPLNLIQTLRRSLHISGLPVVKTFIPISSFCASNSLWALELWEEAINDWTVYENKQLLWEQKCLVESILISNLTCNLKARNKTLSRVADIAKISQISWKKSQSGINTTQPKFIFPAVPRATMNPD